LREGRVYFPREGRGRPRIKQYASEEEGLVPSTLWRAAVVGDNQEAKKEVLEIVQDVEAVGTPKPRRLVQHILKIATDPGDLALDVFAGSGTTADAVICQNREDAGSRRFVIVEVGRFFDDVLMQRIQRRLYAPEWSDHKPARSLSQEEIARTPRLLKILHLESFEDALHSLVSQTKPHEYGNRAKAYRKGVGDDAYRLTYFARLPLEESASLLQFDRLARPFRYTIELLTEHGPREQLVDPIETFNLLYALHVERRECWRNPADPDRLYRVVRGRRRDGRRVVVIWRDVEGLDPAVERAWLEPLVAGVDEALCNADSATPGVRSLDPDFKRLMAEPEPAR
jgi:adenine-specific DNA-methyltransferase